MSIQKISAKALAIASVLGLGMTVPAWANDPVVVEMEADAIETEVDETVSQAEEDVVPTASIAEIVSGVDEFSTLAAALEAAELTEALMGEGPFTVFAPPNAAFEALPEGVVDALLMPENQDLLTDVLTYHVVPGEFMSGDLETGPVETLEGSELPVVIDDDTATVGEIPIVAVDIPASNGVVHVIDGVLVPDEVATELESRLAAMEEEEMVEEEEEEVIVEEEEVVVEEEEPVMEETTEPVPGLW